MPQRHRRTERKKEAMMSVSPAGEDNYDAQRRAFHETAGNKKPEQDSQSESAKPVLGGRAEKETDGRPKSRMRQSLPLRFRQESNPPEEKM